MLDIDGGRNVDARDEQFGDILPAFGVAAPGCVGVREFVNQNELWMPRQRSIDVSRWPSWA